MDPEKARYARDTRARTLAEIVPGADVFLGLSAGGVLKPEMIAGMAAAPPDPGAGQSRARDPPRARAAGRGPTPSCARVAPTTPTRSTTSCAFPSSSAARSTSGATINDAMKLAAVHAIAELARAEASDIVASAYGGRLRVSAPTTSSPSRSTRASSSRIAPAVAQGRHGQRRGHPAARRPRSLSPAHGALRLPLRHQHEAGVPGSQGSAQARDLRRGRGGARAARRAGGGGRGHRLPRPARTRRRDRAAHRDAGAQAEGRRDLRGGQHPERPALSERGGRIL